MHFVQAEQTLPGHRTYRARLRTTTCPFPRSQGEQVGKQLEGDVDKMERADGRDQAAGTDTPAIVEDQPAARVYPLAL